MKKINKSETLKYWNQPVIINGEKISDEELCEFLDWSLVYQNNDFDYFRYLKKNNKFKRPTSAELTAFVTRNDIKTNILSNN